jgi:hypothetical protein
MNMLFVALPRSVMLLVIASSVLGVPVPAVAAGESGGQLIRDSPPLFGPVSLTAGTTEGLRDRLLVRTASASPADKVRKPWMVDAGRVPRVVLLTRSQPSAAPNRSWVKRHPVLFGTIVGAVAGAGMVHATVGREAAFVGFYGGAAAGGVVGLIVSR